MTAEIAILNKTSVALAADSAVTISIGTTDEKIFNTADKLFELSYEQPIGIMVYNSLNFLEMPIPPIIKDFRKLKREFQSVEDAARSFFEYLVGESDNGSSKLSHRTLRRLILPEIEAIEAEFISLSRIEFDALIEEMQQSEPSELGGFGERFRNHMTDKLRELIDDRTATIENHGKAEFVGVAAYDCLDDTMQAALLEEVRDKFPTVDVAELWESFLSLIKALLASRVPSGNFTGIVVAGFAKGDRFPTLCSFAIDGIACGTLKLIKLSENKDIDRDGLRAAVVPFAQTDTVDRFVYGIDPEVRDTIQEFAKETVKEISEIALDHVKGAAGVDSSTLRSKLEIAEDHFSEQLMTLGFERIERDQKDGIEDMVEFMPKTEMAQMAEDLVELTSIKRRVSRGFETVGGPIDVAVISREEGFVWVKRKHYFHPNQNLRYAQRVRDQTTSPARLQREECPTDE